MSLVLEIRAEPQEVGSVIASAYRLERIVGEGGMGVVWAARELRSGRVVALKFLREGRESDLRNQERVVREARAAMAIAHPAVARVEAVLETNAGIPFLVMELLQGESLRAFLRRRGTLNPVECARIFLPVVDAVLAAHGSHIVHRDLKPENVFLSADRCVRVLDFGIAKQLLRAGEAQAASLTSTGALLGTPIYMAPEQVFGDHDIDGSADVWSLGIMLHECLAGRPPTEGDGFGPIIKRITTDPLQPLEQARPGLPRRITSLVGRMLTRERARRPALVEVRAVLAGIADAGEGAAPSERAPDLPPGFVPPSIGGTTTGGLVDHRLHTGAPPASPPRRSRGAVAAAIVAAVGVTGALGATFYVAVARPRLAASRAAPASSSAGFQRAILLSREATAALQRRDGATCLARIDSYDAEYSSPDTGGPSTKAGSNYSGLRAICLMLAGKCSAGTKLYLANMPFALPAGSTMDPETSTRAAEAVTADYCEGPDVTPREELLRANHRLRGFGAAAPDRTDADCRRDAALETKLADLIPGSRGELVLAPGALAACLERAR